MGMDVFGIADPSCYFRASIWSWRPLHCLISEANTRFKLGMSPELLSAMECNGGAGLRSQTECYALADALKVILAETTSEVFTLDADIMGVEAAIESALSAAGWSIGDAAMYEIERAHVEEFIRFLNVCGGFEIW
jgi:hypothetical protein